MKHGFYSLYQPIIHVRTGKILGYEALTRRHGKSHSPEKLFREAYGRGATAALDFACLRSALQILPKLRRKQLLFVNIEPFTLGRSFGKATEGEFLLKAVAPYRRQIVFELTEGMKGRDFKLIKKGVQFLKKNGCRFALDDVAGIGVKLFRLLSLKPDFVKIDISLVRGLGKSRLQRDLFRRIVLLGRKAGSMLIAEGLEQKKDVDLVRKMRISYLQGFYFGRPQKNLLTR